MSREPPPAPVEPVSVAVDRKHDYTYGNWHLYHYVSDKVGEEQVKFGAGREYDYEFKLRLNMPRALFKAHREKIIDFIMQENRPAFEREGHDAIVSFKCIKAAAFDMDEADYRETGQVTMYLRPPFDLEKIQRFSDKLQHFVQTTCGAAEPVPVSAGDVAVKRCPNVSMRLERINGIYQPSGKIKSDAWFRQAYSQLTADTNTYAILAEGGCGVDRAKQHDAVHQLMRFGYQQIYDCAHGRAIDLGNACMKVASLSRQAQMDPQKFSQATMMHYLSSVNAYIKHPQNVLRVDHESLMELLDKNPCLSALCCLQRMSYEKTVAAEDISTLSRCLVEMQRHMQGGDSSERAMLANVISQYDVVNKLMPDLPRQPINAYLAVQSYKHARQREYNATGKETRYGLPQARHKHATFKIAVADKLLAHMENPVAGLDLSRDEIAACQGGHLKEIVDRYALLDAAADVYRLSIPVGNTASSGGAAASAGVPALAP